MHHDGLRQRPKKNARSGGAAAGGGSANGGAAQGGGDGAISCANYDSDEEVGGGLDECLARNAITRVEKDRDAHYRRAEKIIDPGFKEAYKEVWHLKNHDPKPKKDQPPPPPTPNDPEGWVLVDYRRTRNPKLSSAGTSTKAAGTSPSRTICCSDSRRSTERAVRDCVDGKGAALPSGSSRRRSLESARTSSSTRQTSTPTSVLRRPTLPPSRRNATGTCGGKNGRSYPRRRTPTAN
ncbi:unnamed protein product [Pylaiella littoralis]